jgi:hypothetical protein
MKSTQEREQQRRRQKLAAVQEQIRSGSLTVRQLTADERALPAATGRPRRQSALRRLSASSTSARADLPAATDSCWISR